MQVELDLSNLEEVELEVFDLARKPEHSSRTHPDLPNKPGGPDNWVEKVGGLPDFIKRVAKHIFYDSPGMTVSHAIAAAVEQCKKWAAKGNPKAIAAIAQWEAKRGASHAKSAVKKAARNLSDDTELSAIEIYDLSLLTQRRTGGYTTVGNAPSARGTGVRGSAYDESKHPRALGGKFGNKVDPSTLIANKRRVAGNITNLQVGESYTLPDKVGWVKRTPGGYFVQGNGGFTASVRTLSEAIQAAAALLSMKGTKAAK